MLTRRAELQKRPNKRSRPPTLSDAVLLYAVAIPVTFISLEQVVDFGGEAPPDRVVATVLAVLFVIVFVWFFLRLRRVSSHRRRFERWTREPRNWRTPVAAAISVARPA